MSSEEVANGYQKVGVIGAGAAGLVAARELKREGLEVAVYEQKADVGGLWLYDSGVGEDPLGLDPKRVGPNHGTIYQSLRTNLPREVMGFMDYPFLVKEDSRDPRGFPSHQEVFLYLKDFARDFNLLELIRFNTRVEYVGIVNRGPQCVMNGEQVFDMDGDFFNERIQWVVRSRSSFAADSQVEEEIFDAVVVCNGHYRQPKIAEVPGLQKWPGNQIHSMNYRVYEPFYNQVVVIIGCSSSALDISLELVKVAREVHLSVRSKYMEFGKNLANCLNMQAHSTVKYLDEDGTVVFNDGSSVIADSIIHCTGYSYSFPFLDTNGIVTVDNNRVGPLYEHIFPPQLAPSLSFVGIPQKIITFPFFELQSKWIASILARKTMLPSRRDMMKSVKELYDYQEMIGLPKHFTHEIDEREAFEHSNQLADRTGSSCFEEWRKEITKATLKCIHSNPTTFRDSWSYCDTLELLKEKTTMDN
uniref:Flavin-containing monooxygenase n=1 Tax=Araucaria cunninghamii TaxID=56994 RepID=A0A0D6QSY5_ARACU